MVLDLVCVAAHLLLSSVILTGSAYTARLLRLRLILVTVCKKWPKSLQVERQSVLDHWSLFWYWRRFGILFSRTGSKVDPFRQERKGAPESAWKVHRLVWLWTLLLSQFNTSSLFSSALSPAEFKSSHKVLRLDILDYEQHAALVDEVMEEYGRVGIRHIGGVFIKVHYRLTILWTTLDAARELKPLRLI